MLRFAPDLCLIVLLRSGRFLGQLYMNFIKVALCDALLESTFNKKIFWGEE